MMTEHNQNNSVIPFLRAFKLQDLTATSYKPSITTTRTSEGGSIQTAEAKKATVSIITADAPNHQILCRLKEFKRAREQLKWTIGDKLFDVIKDILGDPTDRHAWDVMCGNNDSHS